jgi:hypothetical protein
MSTGYKWSGTGDQEYCWENKAFFVVDAFKIRLTLDARSMICALNADIVIIFGGMISELQNLVNMPFKKHLKQLNSERLERRPYSDTIGPIKRPSVHCCVTGTEAWQQCLQK